MIRHIVIWTIRETGNPRSKLEAMAELKSKLLGLKEQIRVIRKLEVHFNSPSAPQDNFDVILESEFASWADLETYRKHPAHVIVAAYVKNISQNRAALDYEYQ
ncbi:MAG: Dabb family protein [Bacteroidales bacterium]|nr:Dabb family protein [Bacteroidales bacterium]MBN2762161.1 Dabb family protein [Bacteroidales bacterium]